MATESNTATGQQNTPEKGKITHRPPQETIEEVIDSEQQTDQLSGSKNTLSQQDIAEGKKTFEPELAPHMALETKNGKNNGAIPAAFNGQRSNHP